jgi:hypothetical protein
VKTDALLRDPGFQLNLLLWMTRPQPADEYVVRPLFHELEFTLVYIENPFPLPEETLVVARASGLDISMKPEPEVILSRKRDRKALTFEAKASSFSPVSDNSRQARGHLLVAGPAFGEVLAPGFKCLLCYVVPEPDRAAMDSCLTSLAAELRERALSPGPHSLHSLALREADLCYAWDAAFRAHTGIEDDAAVVIRGVSEDTDPSPLLLVVSVEDYPDPKRQDHSRQVLRNQAHTVLLCELNAWPAGTPRVLTVDDILLKTTGGLFRYLGRDRRTAMRRFVRENLFKRILAYWQDRQPKMIGLEGDTLHVHCPDEAQREAFLDWLEDWKRTNFDVTTPPREEQLGLFESEGAAFLPSETP